MNTIRGTNGRAINADKSTANASQKNRGLRVNGKDVHELEGKGLHGWREEIDEEWKEVSEYGKFENQEIIPYATIKMDATNGYGRQDRREAAKAMKDNAPMVGKAVCLFFTKPARYYAKGIELRVLESMDGWTQGGPAAPIGYSLIMIGPAQAAREYIIRLMWYLGYGKRHI